MMLVVHIGQGLLQCPPCVVPEAQAAYTVTTSGWQLELLLALCMGLFDAGALGSCGSG